jgi:hypothetical protein
MVDPYFSLPNHPSLQVYLLYGTVEILDLLLVLLLCGRLLHYHPSILHHDLFPRLSWRHFLLHCLFYRETRYSRILRLPHVSPHCNHSYHPH